MGLHLFWIFQVVLFAALAAEAKPNEHYHRYMLSDYRPQHNPKTQMDYKRHKARTEEDVGLNSTTEQHKSFGRTKEPVVMLTKSNKTMMLHELIVRVYLDHKYICVGTLIAEKLVVTTATCFDGDSPGLLTMKTYTNEVILGSRKSVNDTFIKGEDPMLATIELKTSPRDSKLNGDLVKLCNIKLSDQYEEVDLPLWIRSKHKLHNRKSWTMPVQECRNRMKDYDGTLATDAMLCVRNERYTSTCQNAIGNPLIHKNMICGLNVAGHNCPTYMGVNIYTPIYDELEFAMIGLKLLKKIDIENTIL